MPKDQAERVVEGAMHLSPHLGKRMVAGKIEGRSVFIRELLPQDLKIELEQLDGAGCDEGGELSCWRRWEGACAADGRGDPQKLVE